MAALPPEILGPLEAHRRRIFRGRATAGLTLTSWVALGLFVTSLLADRFLLLPVGVRTAWTTATVTATTLLLGWTLLRALRLPDAVRLAWQLEARHPELDESLASMVQLRRLPDAERRRYSPALLLELQRFAADRLAGVHSEDRGTSGAMAWLLAGSLLAWGAIGSILITDAFSSRQLALRFLRPGADLPRPSTVALAVSPGDRAVALGDTVEIRAVVLRGSPRSAVLAWRHDRGEWVEETLHALEPGLFARQFPGLRHPLEYRVSAGDFASPVSRITPRSPPGPVAFRIHRSYPEATGRPRDFVESQRGDLEAVRGTRVRLEVAANEPLADARLEGFPSQEDASVGSRSTGPAAGRAGSLDLEVVGSSAASAELTLVTSGEYRLFLQGLDGVTNGARDRYSVRVLADASPGVEMIEPHASEIAVERSGFLEVRYRAGDDQGLRSVTLVVSPSVPDSGDTVAALQIPLWQSEAVDFPRELAGSHLMDVQSLDLEAGESATLRLRAVDGRGQQALSAARTLLVASVPPPPEGPGWPGPLGRMEQELSAAYRDWSSLLPSFVGGAGTGPGELDGLPGGNDGEEGLIDAARLEKLARVAEKAAAARGSLSATGRAATECARGLAAFSPDVHRLERLGRHLRRTAAVECSTFWHESTRLTEELRDSLKAPSSPGSEPRVLLESSDGQELRRAHEEAGRRIGSALSAVRALHAAERLEELFERSLGLAWDSAELRAALARAGGAAGAATLPAVEVRAGELLREATLLAADLESHGGAGLPGAGLPGGKEREGSGEASLPSLRPLARGILESVVPDLEALRSREAGVPFSLEECRAAAGRVASSLRIFSKRLRAYHVRSRDLVKVTMDRLEEPPRVDGLLEELVRVSREGAGRPSEETHEPRLLILRSLFLELAEELHRLEALEYRDIRSRLELAATLEIVRNLAEVGTSVNDASFCEKVLEAFRATAPSRRVGTVLSDLHRAAGEEEDLHWSLRASSSPGYRSQRRLARLQRGLVLAVQASIEDLQTLVEESESPEGQDSPGDTFRRGLGDIGDSVQAAGRRLATIEEDLAAPGKATLQCAPLEPCAERQPADAGELARLADETARAGTSLDEAVEALEHLRSTALPGTDAARAWLREALGTLPERISRLARRQLDLASRLEDLARSPAGEDAAREVPDLLLLEDGLGEELGILVSRIRAEGQVLLESGSSTGVIRLRERVAAGLLAVRSAEMRGVTRHLSEARSADPDALPGILMAACAKARKAAELLARLAEILEASGTDEPLEVVGEELETLLDILEAAGSAESPESEDVRGTEIAKTREDLEKLLALAELQEEVGRLLQSLLGQAGSPADMEKLESLQQNVKKELEDRFVTVTELVELVSRLVLLEREAGRLARLERSLAATLERPPGERGEVPTRHEQLATEGRKMVRDFHDAGFKLSSVLPMVFRSFVRARFTTDAYLSSLEEAGERLSAPGDGESPRPDGEGAARSGEAALLAVAEHLDELQMHLRTMRQESLEALADQERGEGGPNAALLGLERARLSVNETLRLIRDGSLRAAARVQDAGMRSIADSQAALRSHLRNLVVPGGVEGQLMSRVLNEEARSLGLAWEVPTRGEDSETDRSRYLRGGEEMPYPVDYRDLVRVYLLALGADG